MGQDGSGQKIIGTVRSTDGVAIFYTLCGAGEVTLAFIHGGFADRSFWEPQVEAFAGRYQVVALDLAGHGESGRDRRSWQVSSFAEDVRAVLDAVNARRAVLIGNSMGGPVAVEAAQLLPGRVAAVVAVDTFHDATAKTEPEFWRDRAEAFRRDFPGTCAAMVRALFHPDVDRALLESVERRMGKTGPEIAAALMETFATYDLAGGVRRAGVPIRAINGDLYPTSVERNRALAPDFDAVVMKHTGHFPMMERPDEFNRILGRLVRGLV
jgi:pimeloyl-ACP methyl ester carboxylesterase